MSKAGNKGHALPVMGRADMIVQIHQNAAVAKEQERKDINMRELKFRAFNKSTKEMYPCAGFLSGLVVVMQDGQTLGYKDDDWEIQQYTGLKDNNGREIYEGDVLQYTAPAFATFKSKDTTESGAVVFDRAVFWCNYPLYEVVSPDWNCTIIGNIMENPELLNVS